MLLHEDTSRTFFLEDTSSTFNQDSLILYFYFIKSNIEFHKIIDVYKFH